MESIIDILSQGRDREAQASKIYGFVIGIVTNNQDPDGLCRVKVKFPWLSDDVESWWARCAQPMAGAGRGTMLIPEIEDEVLIGFEHGDVRFPYVVGALHNGKDSPPMANKVTSKFGGTGYDHGGHTITEVNEDNKNNVRMFKSRAGSLVLFDDTDGKERIVVSDSTGHRRFEIRSDGDSNKSVIVLTNETGNMELITEKTLLMRCQDFKVEARKTGIMDFGTTLKVTSKDDMTHETKKNSTHKTGMNCTIDAGMNMTQKAAMNFDAKGGINFTAKAGVAIKVQGTMAEVNGSAMTQVKGGIVMIN